MPNTTYVDKTTVVTTPSVQDFNNAAYGPTGHPFWGGSAGGSANAITITTTIVPSALASGQVYRCKITAANTTAVTVNANALGVKALVARGSIALVANSLQINDIITFVYDLAADNFQLIGVGPAIDYSITSLPNLLTAASLSALPSVVSGSVFRKNCIINGAMRIAQRGTSFVAVAVNAYTLDRWRYGKSGAMVHTITQDTDVPTVAQAGVLFTNSLRLNLTTADTAIAAGDYAILFQTIEGYNFQRIAQRAFTASFWVKATTAGVYSISFGNSGFDRSYVSNFTISAGSTWEYKTIAVSASPTAGTWNYTNGAGLGVNITLAAGTTFQTTAGAWQTGNFLGTASNINGVNTGATDFRIVGVQVEPGNVATEFEMDPIEDEISRAQRYYWKSFAYATAPAQNVGTTAGALFYRVPIAGVSTVLTQMVLPVLLRASPTLTFYNPNAANSNWRNASLGADSGASATNSSTSDRALVVDNAQVAGDLLGHSAYVHVSADAEL